MSDAGRERVVADEIAVERQYNKALANRANNAQYLTRQNVNNTWTTNTVTNIPKDVELIGRIALDELNASLEVAQNFYIGTTKHDGDGIQVFSWAAPIAACTYYRNSADREDLEDLSDSVVGVRVFAHHLGEIADYQDEITGEYAPIDVFPKRALQIPRAPTSRPTAPAANVTEPNEPAVAIEPAPGRQLLTTLAPHTKSSPAMSVSGVIPGPALRAPDLLRRQLAAPKSATMSAVLATLQPDQYEAITKPARESQFLQGHPGTGKTIVAVHRAAYLLNTEAPPEARPRGHVLILGPTAEYSDHIRAALRKLIPHDDTYVVTSIPTLLEELAGLPRSTVPTETMAYSDVDPELARLVDQAYRNAKDRLEGALRPDRASTYADLVGLLQDPPPEGLGAEWVTYLRGMPHTYDELQQRRERRFRGLMAYIGVLVDRSARNPGHVIVDEAQDIHPIEWEVLGRLGNSGGWTILGDLNQRRTDHTFNTWDDVANLLAVEDDDGHAPIQLLERGYRSTAQIIKFANQLLPARDRALYSLQQDGEVPTVTRVLAEGDLIHEAVSATESLCARVAQGTVAVITVDTAKMSKAIMRRGWKVTGADQSVWRKNERELRLLPPERARGLEFDGVVVIEPADFPENVGRQGVLYTALSRANRYLTIVHRRAMPRGMKTKI